MIPDRKPYRLTQTQQRKVAVQTHERCGVDADLKDLRRTLCALELYDYTEEDLRIIQRVAMAIFTGDYEREVGE